MLDKIIEKSPAKINLFLKIVNKRNDGYHNIRTGITFINLYDEVTIQPYHKFLVHYSGKFAPKNNMFKDCIIKKIFLFLKIKEPNLLITISKNFPYQAGLGSASSNAATVIRMLENLEIIKKINIHNYADLGADIPFFLNQRDALVRGRGDLISNMIFPKYYFLLIQPSFVCSTKEMYESFNYKDLNYKKELDLEEINDHDNGNDFEKILSKNQPEFKSLISNLENLEGSIFSRVTGSGSCLFSVFEKKEQAEQARKAISKEYSQLWTVIAENNNINLF